MVSIVFIQYISLIYFEMTTILEMKTARELPRIWILSEFQRNWHSTIKSTGLLCHLAAIQPELSHHGVTYIYLPVAWIARHSWRQSAFKMSQKGKLQNRGRITNLLPVKIYGFIIFMNCTNEFSSPENIGMGVLRNIIRCLNSSSVIQTNGGKE